MDSTLYRRPLPAEAIAFSSAAGRELFAATLAAGGLNGYFPLAEQFHTQSEPAYCGLGSLVVALNALAIDPGRLWKGPWRWFGEELLDCCVPLEEVKKRGLALGELACLARCNGAEVNLVHADATNGAAWREALTAAAQGDAVLIASYDRALVGQSGSGHFSPIGGYSAARDLALVLDVARFKYPPHWLSAERLWEAMQSVDPATERTRGWMLLRPRAQGIAVGFSVTCVDADWQGLARRLTAVLGEVGADAEVAVVARALAPLSVHIGVRTPTTPAHQEALAKTRAALRELPLYAQVESAIGPDDAEAVSMLLLASMDRGRVTDGLLADELASLRAQIAALSP